MTDISVTISEEPVAVSIGSGTGPAGAAGSSGVITVSAPLTNSGTSTAAILGLSVGSGLSIVSGALTAVAGSYTLPVASASVLGGVIQGSNVTIDGTGILSVAAPVTWSTLTGKPTFATVATSGAYADLSGKPTLGTAAASSTTDFAAASHTHGNITNAGAIGSTSGQIVVTTTSGVLTTAATIAASAVAGLATVATSGSYADLSAKPMRPYAASIIFG